MSFYKELFNILLEISFSIFIIIFGYNIWNNFDLTDYNAAKYYDDIKEVQIFYESNTDKGYSNNNSVISIHNISDKTNNKDVILKLNKDNKLDNILLDINQKKYNLNDLYLKEDEIYKYYLIDNSVLEGYETKTYFIDFELENNVLLYDYEFITEV